MASVTWYDLLGLDRDATPEQIRVAWREATDRAEPGTSQFKKYNEAAEVLLDDRRPARRTTPSWPRPSRSRSRSRSPRPSLTATTSTPASSTADLPATHTEGAAVPRWAALLASTAVTVALTLVTVLVIAVGGYFWFQNNRHDEQDDAGQEASAAAERALPFVLSYDYRQLPADKARAVRYLSPKYKKEYTATFDKLIASADGQAGAGQADLGRGQGDGPQRRRGRLRGRRGEGDRVRRPGDDEGRRHPEVLAEPADRVDGEVRQQLARGQHQQLLTGPVRGTSIHRFRWMCLTAGAGRLMLYGNDSVVPSEARTEPLLSLCVLVGYDRGLRPPSNTSCLPGGRFVVGVGAIHPT